ncbi:MAG: hypothetical protein K2V38_04420, partial [Gemmataceae bacterium]|nr:hypothetical protein [Gemmataceae bacterium]
GYEPPAFGVAPRFGPHVQVCGGFVLAQSSDGKRWFVRLDTGRPAPQPSLGELTALVCWPHPPRVLAPGRVAVPDGPGLVRVLNIGGRMSWAFEAKREDGLTGTPPQVRAWGDALLVALRYNHGIEIERLDPARGTPEWTDPAFVDAFDLCLAHADADADRVYVPGGNKLWSFALSDGKPAWAANLPDAHGAPWIVRAGKSCVIAYPARAIAREPTPDVRARLGRSFLREPAAWRLPGLLVTLYDAWVDRALPVLLFDPETGRRVGGYSLPARGPAVGAWLDRTTAVFATGDRVVWIK